MEQVITTPIEETLNQEANVSFLQSQETLDFIKEEGTPIELKPEGTPIELKPEGTSTEATSEEPPKQQESVTCYLYPPLNVAETEGLDKDPRAKEIKALKPKLIELANPDKLGDNDGVYILTEDEQGNPTLKKVEDDETLPPDVPKVIVQTTNESEIPPGTPFRNLSKFYETKLYIVYPEKNDDAEKKDNPNSATIKTEYGEEIEVETPNLQEETILIANKHVTVQPASLEEAAKLKWNKYQISDADQDNTIIIGTKTGNLHTAYREITIVIPQEKLSERNSLIQNILSYNPTYNREVTIKILVTPGKEEEPDNNQERKSRLQQRLESVDRKMFIDTIFNPYIIDILVRNTEEKQSPNSSPLGVTTYYWEQGEVEAILNKDHIIRQQLQLEGEILSEKLSSLIDPQNGYFLFKKSTLDNGRQRIVVIIPRKEDLSKKKLTDAIKEAQGQMPNERVELIVIYKGETKTANSRNALIEEPQALNEAQPKSVEASRLEGIEQLRSGEEVERKAKSVRGKQPATAVTSPQLTGSQPLERSTILSATAEELKQLEARESPKRQDGTIEAQTEQDKSFIERWSTEPPEFKRLKNLGNMIYEMPWWVYREDFPGQTIPGTYIPLPDGDVISSNDLKTQIDKIGTLEKTREDIKEALEDERIPIHPTQEEKDAISEGSQKLRKEFEGIFETMEEEIRSIRNGVSSTGDMSTQLSAEEIDRRLINRFFGEFTNPKLNNDIESLKENLNNLRPNGDVSDQDVIDLFSIISDITQVLEELQDATKNGQELNYESKRQKMQQIKELLAKL